MTRPTLLRLLFVAGAALLGFGLGLGLWRVVTAAGYAVAHVWTMAGRRDR